MIITHHQILVFFLIFARFAGLIIFAPLFSRREFFTVARVAFLIWSSALFLFVLPMPEIVPEGIYYLFSLCVEMLIGLLVGMVMDVMITGLEYAGTIVDIQSGLSGAALLDPSTGTQVTVFTALLKWTATMMFLIIDGHHMILASIVQSFYILPLGTLPNITEGIYYILSLGTTIFYLATVFSASVALVMFLVDFGFGILNKIAEQVNVFSIGFQIKPSIALVVFIGLVPGLIYSIERVLEEIAEDMVQLFMALQV